MALSSLMVLCFVFVNGNFEKFGTGRNGKEIRQWASKVVAESEREREREWERKKCKEMIFLFIYFGKKKIVRLNLKIKFTYKIGYNFKLQTYSIK